MRSKIVDIYTAIFPHYSVFLRKELADCRSILDLGCGVGSPAEPFSLGAYSVGVELYLPSLLKCKKAGFYADLVHGDVTKVQFKPKFFGCVICSDLIEHLTKGEGLALIKKMEEIAVEKVLIITPNGFNKKEYFEDGNSLQMHKSGWTVEEFRALGYEVKGALGLKVLRGEREAIRFRPWALWELVSDLTQKVTFSYPQYAYHILCVKKLKKAS